MMIFPCINLHLNQIDSLCQIIINHTVECGKAFSRQFLFQSVQFFSENLCLLKHFVCLAIMIWMIGFRSQCFRPAPADQFCTFRQYLLQLFTLPLRNHTAKLDAKPLFCKHSGLIWCCASPPVKVIRKCHKVRQREFISF